MKRWPCWSSGAGRLASSLSDQRMPGMSGVELLERARTLAPDAKRMLVTAYADLQAVVDAVNRGQVTRYFVKPWDRAEMLAALEDALKIARLELKIREVESRMMKAERLATLGQVTAGIAHELMGPVGYLSQNVSALRRDIDQVIAYVNKHLAEDPDAAVSDTVKDLPALIGDLATGTEHLRQVAHGLKAQARGDETEQAAEIAEVVSFAVKLARAEVRDRARLTSSGEPVRVLFGPVKLCQVLLNLIVNAAQAMEGIGRPGPHRRELDDAGPQRGAHRRRTTAAASPWSCRRRCSSRCSPPSRWASARGWGCPSAGSW